MSDPEDVTALSSETTQPKPKKVTAPVVSEKTPSKTITVSEKQTPVSSSTSLSISPENRQIESIDDWINLKLEYILNSTLSQQKSSKYTYLDSLAKENSKFTSELVDSVLLEILTEIGVDQSKYKSAFDFLADCWTRAKNVRRLIKADEQNKLAKISLADEAIRLTSSYSLILFLVPDMFINEVNVQDVIRLLWSSVDKYDSFLMDIITRSIENDNVLEFLNVFLPSLAQQLLTLNYSTDTDYSKIVTVYQIFVSNKIIASQIYLVDGFNPEGLKANEFELKTTLGPLLRVSALLPEVAVSNYPDGLTKPQIKTIHESLHSEQLVLMNRLFGICDKIVRSGEACRMAFLKYLADIVNKNHLRRGEHANPKKLASDSFMFCITIILVKLSQPFLSDGIKIDKISTNYLNCRNRLLDLHEETKINSTIQEYDEYYSEDKLSDLPLNFISECFYLLLGYLHYGFGGMITSSERLVSYIRQLTQELAKLEQMIQKTGGGGSNPITKMLIDTRLTPMKKELQKMKSMKLSIDMCSLNRELQLEIFDVITGAIKFFIRLIEPTHTYPNVSLKIPLHNLDDDVDKFDDVEYLRTISPVPFKYFPEFFVEGVVNYCHYIAKFNNNPMLQNEKQLTQFLEFAITILRCPELVNNPHLKARLTEVLFFGSLPMVNNMDGYMINIFNNNDLVKENLIISLLDFYVMVEKTGASSQFYDKFNARCHISMILEQLWKFDYFRADLKRISKNQKFFVRLIARMLNDTTYLLDESLNHLQTIGNCQREIASRQKGNAPTTEETDEDLTKKLQDSERMAKSLVQLSNKTIQLFDLFTKEIPTAFIIIEIVDRLAGMLNYNLVALVGPKCNELRVQNPENYHFNPSDLLLHISSIFINLSDEKEFINAVARDSRSFNPACFKRAIQILNKVGKIDYEFSTKLDLFVGKAEQVKQEDEEEEMELGDIPDEFLDPLMFTLMKDPVKLPHSKVSMDRSVLKAHLMNDPTDPFNRNPLKLEDVEDDVELREKINRFIQERRHSVPSSASTLKKAFDAIELKATTPQGIIKELSDAYDVPEILVRSLFNMNGRNNQSNLNDRKFIISLESEIIEFIMKPNVDSWKMTPLNSYYRLLTHKLAEYYNLGHILSNDGYSMVLFKINTSLVNADDETKKWAIFDNEGNIKPLDFRSIKFDPNEKLNRIQVSELFENYKSYFTANLEREEEEERQLNKNGKLTRKGSRDDSFQNGNSGHYRNGNGYSNDGDKPYKRYNNRGDREDMESYHDIGEDDFDGRSRGARKGYQQPSMPEYGYYHPFVPYNYTYGGHPQLMVPPVSATSPHVKGVSPAPEHLQAPVESPGGVPAYPYYYPVPSSPDASVKGAQATGAGSEENLGTPTDLTQTSAVPPVHMVSPYQYYYSPYMNQAAPHPGVYYHMGPGNNGVPYANGRTNLLALSSAMSHIALNASWISKLMLLRLMRLFMFSMIWSLERPLTNTTNRSPGNVCSYRSFNSTSFWANTGSALSWACSLDEWAESFVFGFFGGPSRGCADTILSIVGFRAGSLEYLSNRSSNSVLAVSIS
ncbi:hypothetical protein OGAPHI_000093 [Ogataea philodendri]|uniref:RING-type E3 ubiquitin transferase n=2 Tax=Saccharomycotina TaxID=147537 RepID=A0A9P8PIH7_9ASCO|nr:uncharacterized protein OGAPHI_000093 [Ogataea philodendri]KAH3671907.1 hypothetical protein OGAPHI_000093 [Ogataea philodendri]